MLDRTALHQRLLALLLSSLLALLAAGCSIPVSQAPASANPTLAAVAPSSAPSTNAPVAPTAGVPTVQPSATAVPSATPAPSTATPAPPTATPEPTAVPLQPFDPALAAELQRILDQSVADGYIPGITLSVSLPGYKPWVGVSGVADRTQLTPMTPDTRVRIASISKTFTAIVVLQLVEEGKLGLDTPLEEYLPGLLRNGEAITVRQLLQHTTGLYDYLEDRNFVVRAYQTPARVWAPSELVKYAVQFPPAFAPGAADNWDYSSTNYVILGMIVEQVTGRTLGQELRERIFEPLGMGASYFAPEESVEGPYARGYSRSIDQSNAPMSLVFGTASIVATASDVRRFGEALLNGDLLSPAMQEQMFGFVSGYGQYNMPALEYGLGVMRNRLPTSVERSDAARTVVGHIGGFGGFRSALWAAPESGATLALGINQAATDPNLLAAPIFEAILNSLDR